MKSLYIVPLSLVLAGCSPVKEHGVEWHWTRVREYQQYVNGKITKDEFGGYKYHDGEPDILPSLHALDKASEVSKIDLVFPQVPKSKEVTKYWMNLCNRTEGIVDAYANPSYVEFKTRGVQPFRMIVWYKPEYKDEILKMINKIEQFEQETQQQRE